MPMTVLCFGLNWSGVQLTIWTGMAIDNANKLPFKEAFRHALNGEKVIVEEDSCICVPCQFINWKHGEEDPFPNELYVGQNLLEGVIEIKHHHFLYEYTDVSLLSDLNHRPTTINSPPLSPPARPFV